MDKKKELVEIVRCKNCTHFCAGYAHYPESHDGMCGNTGMDVDNEFFCADGEVNCDE